MKVDEQISDRNVPFKARERSWRKLDRVSQGAVQVLPIRLAPSSVQVVQQGASNRDRVAVPAPALNARSSPVSSSFPQLSE